MEESTFKKYFYEHYKGKYKFAQPKMDVCSTCIKLKSLMMSLDKDEKVMVMNILQAHVEEADKRYANWKRDKLAVKPNSSEEEIRVMEESKSK